ncbi:di-trans,poly-cis-decaprenylcistransferase [Lichtheimia ornata]|uniref:Alkyl transferase n=1 Tax=Lichtheimia ornata TaxID=688661 RepID=A0AAD7UX38_9FUNG|nr:di-trans,poly-cis-decaprenylcistransferase [Lichtheimia ornata]KAJ8654688.1 di-trans,poly-cis-decaprenylcistransferase [Lichtheimia ornata]
MDTLQRYLDSTNDMLQDVCIKVLSKGRIPRHIGFILDGNRRFARKAGAESTKFGHYEGFRQLQMVLDFCMRLGIEAVTVYAFSIENFKRSADEVDYLMQLFREVFTSFCDKNELVDKYEIGIHFCGNRSLLPPDVAELTRKVEARTQHHKTRIFNICCPYTSRDEITTAIRENVRSVEQKQRSIEDINKETLESQMFTSASPPLEILIRTSGEIRLSDFLLWQSSDQCQIQFVECYWPEFSLWKFLPILLEYQIYAGSTTTTTR